MGMEKEVIRKWARVAELLPTVRDELVHKFFSLDSEEMLDEKIEVLERLAAGEAPADIPNYYEVLELYPTDDGIWD